MIYAYLRWLFVLFYSGINAKDCRLQRHQQPLNSAMDIYSCRRILIAVNILGSNPSALPASIYCRFCRIFGIITGGNLDYSLTWNISIRDIFDAWI